MVLSLLLFLITVPHTLEDFSVGEPQQAGVPVLGLAFVVAGLLALQGLALFWIGQRSSKGFVVHAVLGLLWPLLAGAAQLQAVLGPEPYRAGIVSELLVIGIIVVGTLLFLASIRAAMAVRAVEKKQPVIQ